MYKKLLCSLLAMVMLLVLLLTACQDAGEPVSYAGRPAISPGLQREIENALLDAGYIRFVQIKMGTTMVDVVFQWDRWGENGKFSENIRYYGSFDGWDVFYAWISGGVVHGPTPSIIGQYNFGQNNTSGIVPLFVYKDGKVHRLKEAYEEGYISDESMEKLVKIHDEEKKKSHLANGNN